MKDRTPRLVEIHAHCTAALAAAPANPLLADESLRGYVLLISGHFQGFCRDLYTECVQVTATKLAPELQATVEMQFSAELKLNSHNPTVETIRKDFERFAVYLDFSADPANGPRITDLGQLNKWRNTIAHQNPRPPIGSLPLVLAAVQQWQTSCDGLATWLDDKMYQEMFRINKSAPW